MSAQLVARGVAAGHGARTLFSDVDLVLAPGHVLGVVGPNGAGKSTLLRVLAGLDEPAAGQVLRTPPHATVGLLPQETERRTGESVAAHLARRTGVTAAQVELDEATTALARAEPGAEDRYSTALERWLALGAADLDERAGAAAAQLGLDVTLDQEMTTLSGGQAGRVNLAVVLLSRFDVLLLDEPTNDLDLAGLELLEDLVRRTDAAVALISHDREFLARTVTEVLELDLHQQQWHLHGGGYDAYLVERERRRAAAQDRYEDYRDTVDSLTERARTQRGWADKGARTARRDQSEKDKFIRHHNIATSEQLAAKARRTEKMIERLDEVEEPRKEWDLRLSIAQAPPSGREVVRLEHAVVERGDFTLGPITVALDRGDRVAVTGSNGSGKTTLLGLLLGTIEPDRGRVVHGASVQVGELDQARRRFTGDDSLLDACCAALPAWPTSEVRTLLAKFGLRADHVQRAAASASPGERTRASLAVLQALGVNLLVLDEPTNHLDLPAVEQLESALDLYDGTVVLVTHDRRLLAAFRRTRAWELDHGQLTEPG
jgi:ATPase subunit of ABC transporter with duplicated ATPase domains